MNLFEIGMAHEISQLKESVAGLRATVIWLEQETGRLRKMHPEEEKTEPPKMPVPELSTLSTPYAVAITELEMEIGFLRSALQNNEDMDGSMMGDLYKIYTDRYPEDVKKSIERIFRIQNQTAEIRFQEMLKKKPRWYYSVQSPGRVVKTDGSYRDGKKEEYKKPKGGDSDGVQE